MNLYKVTYEDSEWHIVAESMPEPWFSGLGMCHQQTQPHVCLLTTN